jgi:hypothetical protein
LLRPLYAVVSLYSVDTSCGTNIDNKLFCTLASFFNFHMAARTLSNSLEMILTTIALNYWPLDEIVAYDNTNWIR